MSEKPVFTINGQRIEQDKNELVYQLIKDYTHLDRGMTNAILKMGNPIKHPYFVATAKFAPALSPEPSEKEARK